MNSIYHAGEIAVQTRAGVRAMARRAGNSIRGTLDRAAAEFLAEHRMHPDGSSAARVLRAHLRQVRPPGPVRDLAREDGR